MIKKTILLVLLIVGTLFAYPVNIDTLRMRYFANGMIVHVDSADSVLRSTGIFFDKLDDRTTFPEYIKFNTSVNGGIYTENIAKFIFVSTGSFPDPDSGAYIQLEGEGLTGNVYIASSVAGEIWSRSPFHYWTWGGDTARVGIIPWPGQGSAIGTLSPSDGKLNLFAASGGIGTGISIHGDTVQILDILVSDKQVFFTRVHVDSACHIYGGFEGQAETVECGVGDWNHITNAGNDLWTIDEADGVAYLGDTLTITNSGDYTGSISVSLSAVTGKDFHIRTYNITQTSVMGRAMGVSTTGASNETNVSFPLYIEATAGDEIRFEISSDDGTDAVVDDGMFYFGYLHD